MKDKILIWIDWNLIFFGIAKSLKEKYDCDLNVIIDINNITKKFFLNQQLVEFQKTWFYRDIIKTSKKNIDLKYLQNFEEKYQINLWECAFADRRFFKYNNYYQFNHDEILSILEQECKFFEKVLDEVKPEFLIIKTTDHNRNLLLHQICKAKGIKILMLSGTRFGYRIMISTDFDKFDDSNLPEEHSDFKYKSFDELQDYFTKFNSFKQTRERRDISQIGFWKKGLLGLRFLILVCNNNYRSWWGHSGRTRLKVLKKEFVLTMKKLYRTAFLNRNCIKQIDSQDRFIYFPLHVEPERVFTMVAPFYTNQVAVITNIAKSLPVGYQLYVKEHKDMKSYGWQSTRFYKEILKIPNVKLVHPLSNPEELLKKCSMVITIAGTTGLQAAFFKKPTILFSDLSYSNLPFVHKIQNIEELPHVIRTLLKKKFDYSALYEYVKKVDFNSFYIDFIGLRTDMVDSFFSSGEIIDSEISIQQMTSFLKRQKDAFDLIADEYIKKIKNK